MFQVHSNIRPIKCAPIRAGMCGIGGYGRYLLETLIRKGRDMVGVEAVVIVAPDADRRHREYLQSVFPEVRIYSDWSDFLASDEDLDLVVLPVGIPAHRELTVSAVERGWNVLLEKPLAGSVQQAKDIIRAQEKTGRLVAIGFQDMYGEAAWRMKAAILSGKIGSLERIRVFGIWGRSIEYYLRNSWAGKLTLNGAPVFDSPMNNGMAHYLNLALFLAGSGWQEPATPLSCEAKLLRAHAIESCDTVAAKWQTVDGVPVSVYFSHLGRRDWHPEIVVEGSRGTIVWKLDGGWEIRAAGNRIEKFAVEQGDVLRDAMVSATMDRVRGGQSRIFTPAQALPQVMAVEMAHEAAVIEDISEHAMVCRPEREEGGDWLEVPGLAEALHAAYESGSPLSASKITRSAKTYA